MSIDWITTAEAAGLSGYNAEHLRRLIRAGKIKGRKFGTLWQVDRASLSAYLITAETSDDKRMGPKRAGSG